MGFRWVTSPTDVFPAMAQQYTQAVFQSVRQLANSKAQEMEDWAKANAPWQDRTGAARAGLNATVQEGGQNTTITLAHGVDYGIWLEVANGGRFAIIAKAVDQFGPSFMQDLQRMLSGGALPGFTYSGSAGRFRSTSSGRFVSGSEIVGRLGA